METMSMEIDLEQIKKMAAEKEDENWEFRSFLKMTDIPARKIDATVHRLYQTVSSRIDCKKCANCCREITPALSKKDIERLSKGTGIPVTEFKEKYLCVEEGDFVFNQTPCPFLKDNLCTQYSYRPHDCRSFPHLQKKDFTSRLITVVKNYALCPIVFHVYEELKKEFWGKQKSVARRGLW